MGVPERSCDLVMKGGVTSGVVYPMAVKAIAEEFSLVGIGGTSAGAIAAVVTAAAEYRRRTTGGFEGFDKLDEVVQELSVKGRMRALFLPDSETTEQLDTALALQSGKGSSNLFKAKLFWKLRNKKKREAYFRPIVENGFGVCSGMAVGEHLALTPWLSKIIDDIAGLPKGRHLTFEDLHNAQPVAGMSADDRSIDLRTVATCLTFNRPFEFPTDDNTLAFDPAEFRKLFPASVVSQLEQASGEIESNTLRIDGKIPLPKLKLPIIVAARMSLSFPLLLSMVPLWGVNYHEKTRPLQRLWFSDGGITSNFPVHRFDSIYPKRPTLAINLQYYDDQPQRSRLKNSKERVYLYSGRGPILDLWNTFEQSDSALSDLIGFGSSIFSSAQNWHDNAFLKLPGYRERVAEVWLHNDEGGLNLDMSKETIDGLVEKGRDAGRKLVERYLLAASEKMSWQAHRWTRFRAGMEALTEILNDLGVQIGSGEIDDSDLKQLLASVDAPAGHKFQSQAELKRAEDFTRALAVLVKDIDPEKPPFANGPKPKISLGSKAPF